MRYEFEDEEPQEGLDDFLEELEDDEDAFVEIAQVNLVNFELHIRLLVAAIKVAKKTFFWRFMRLGTKLKRIRQSYLYLSSLLGEEDDANLSI